MVPKPVRSRRKPRRSTPELSTRARLNQIRKQVKRQPPAIRRVTTLAKGVRQLEAAADKMTRRQEAVIRQKYRAGTLSKPDLELLASIRIKGWRLLEPRKLQLEGYVFRDIKFPQVLNLRSFRELASARFRVPKSFHSLFMFDIDYFKKINDAFGHDAGDRVLSLFSIVLQEKSNAAGGFAGRHGGEEFVVYAPLNRQAAQILVKDIRATVQKRFAREVAPSLVRTKPVRSPQLRMVLQQQLPFSVGLVSLARGADYDAAEKQADKLLYRAKETRSALVMRVNQKNVRTPL